jgi:hypothetical protein
MDTPRGLVKATTLLLSAQIYLLDSEQNPAIVASGTIGVRSELSEARK